MMRRNADAYLVESGDGERAIVSDGELVEESPAEVLPGDICVVKPFDRGAAVLRLFLVTEAERGWCEGMLASIETELATEVDVVLSAPETGLGYPIVVHTRYSGPIWMTQIQRRVGAVRAETLDEIERLAWNDEAEVTLPVGLSLQPDPFDPRYPALQALSAELDDLTDHCRRRRGDVEQRLLDSVTIITPLECLRAYDHGRRTAEELNMDRCADGAAYIVSPLLALMLPAGAPWHPGLAYELANAYIVENYHVTRSEWSGLWHCDDSTDTDDYAQGLFELWDYHVEPALHNAGYVVESDADCGMTWIYRPMKEER